MDQWPGVPSEAAALSSCPYGLESDAQSCRRESGQCSIQRADGGLGGVAHERSVADPSLRAPAEV